MSLKRRKKVASNGSNRRFVTGGVRLPRWRNLGTSRKAFSLTTAVLVFVILGVLGMNMLGIGHAFSLDGCYSTSNGASAKFWDDFYVHTYANKYAATIGHLGPGCHTVFTQVQCFGNGSTVNDSGYYNDWWVYFPDRGGWVNEVHASDGGDNQNAWSTSVVPRASSGNC